jgi:hypothetical protein
MVNIIESPEQYGIQDCSGARAKDRLVEKFPEGKLDCFEL